MAGREPKCPPVEIHGKMCCDMGVRPGSSVIIGVFYVLVLSKVHNFNITVSWLHTLTVHSKLELHKPP